MIQKIADSYDRFSILFTDTYFRFAAVSAYHYPVDRQGKSGPLIFFDSSIIMGIRQYQASLFILGSGFQW